MSIRMQLLLALVICAVVVGVVGISVASVQAQDNTPFPTSPPVQPFPSSPPVAPFPSSPPVAPFPSSPPVSPFPSSPPVPPFPSSLPSPTWPSAPCLFGFLFCDNDLRYISMGDSLAQGLVATQGYGFRYERFIEIDNNLHIDRDLRAQSGWTSTNLAHALTTNAALRDDIATADIITWNIGGNDLRLARDKFLRGQCGGADNQECLRHAVIEFRSNWSQIVLAIQQLTNNRPVMVRSMDLYNPFIAEDIASGNAAILVPYWQATNAHIHQSLNAAAIPFAKVSVQFNGTSGTNDPKRQGYISFDGYHPNDRGHRVIAEALRQLGYSGLSSEVFVPLPSFELVPHNITSAP